MILILDRNAKWCIATNLSVVFMDHRISLLFQSRTDNNMSAVLCTITGNSNTFHMCCFLNSINIIIIHIYVRTSIYTCMCTCFFFFVCLFSAIVKYSLRLLYLKRSILTWPTVINYFAFKWVSRDQFQSINISWVLCEYKTRLSGVFF